MTDLLQIPISYSLTYDNIVEITNQEIYKKPTQNCANDPTLWRFHPLLIYVQGYLLGNVRPQDTSKLKICSVCSLLLDYHTVSTGNSSYKAPPLLSEFFVNSVGVKFFSCNKPPNYIALSWLNFQVLLNALQQTYDILWVDNIRPLNSEYFNLYKKLEKELMLPLYFIRPEYREWMSRLHELIMEYQSKLNKMEIMENDEDLKLTASQTEKTNNIPEEVQPTQSYPTLQTKPPPESFNLDHIQRQLDELDTKKNEVPPFLDIQQKDMTVAKANNNLKVQEFEVKEEEEDQFFQAPKKKIFTEQNLTPQPLISQISPDAISLIEKSLSGNLNAPQVQQEPPDQNLIHTKLRDTQCISDSLRILDDLFQYIKDSSLQGLTWPEFLNNPHLPTYFKDLVRLKEMLYFVFTNSTSLDAQKKIYALQACLPYLHKNPPKTLQQTIGHIIDQALQNISLTKRQVQIVTRTLGPQKKKRKPSKKF